MAGHFVVPQGFDVLGTFLLRLRQQIEVDQDKTSSWKTTFRTAAWATFPLLKWPPGVHGAHPLLKRASRALCSNVRALDVAHETAFREIFEFNQRKLNA